MFFFIILQFIQNLEHKAIAKALILNLVSKTYRWYVDDKRFTSNEQSHEFQSILNKQDKHIQFTIEDENEEKCLNFLDIKIKNNNERYEFDVHGKPALTNVQVKLHNYQHIQRISCESYKNLFWKIFEEGNRTSNWYILQKWTW